MEPTDLIAPSQLAKSLGIRMQSIYSRVRSGQLQGYGEKPVRVSESEARKLLGESKGKARRGVPRGPRRAKAEVAKGTLLANATRSGGVTVRQVKQTHQDEVTGEPTLVRMSGGAYAEPTELQAHLEKGISKIVSVGQVVGLLLISLVDDGQVEAAASLEVWADKHGVEVVVEEEDDET